VADRTRVDERLTDVLRDERGRLTAALVRILGDWDLAEEPSARTPRSPPSSTGLMTAFRTTQARG
jgi:hypothetical protein